MSGSNPRSLRSDNVKQNSVFDKYNKQRKQRKKYKVKKFVPGLQTAAKKLEVFDAKGVHIQTGLDLCDCLDVNCEGCFFKCPNKKCKSNKCGPDCRQKRKYYYESIEDPIHETKITNQIVNKSDVSSETLHIR